MRTTLDLPDETFRQLKAEAALRGETLKEFLRRLIETGLAAEPEVLAARRPRSPLPILRPPTGIVHPALSNPEVEDILTIDDSHARP